LPVCGVLVYKAVTVIIHTGNTGKTVAVQIADAFVFVGPDVIP
jgi:hypothetical protein